MGIFTSSLDSSTPNVKPYELRYEDGDRYRYEQHGRQAVKLFDLATAIRLADMEAGNGVQLFVVDPHTDTVLWAGQQATR